MEIWHNPRCTKSRQTLGLLEDAGVEPEVRLYLHEPPSAGELRGVLDRLGMQPWELVRTKEPVADELGLADWPRDEEHRDRWIDAMVANPILIERPVVLTDDGRAVLGRPPENVEALL
ncbi:MAG: arsenate reductase (glutaredoxin) [Actinobacteria bacterium]|nr:arsenate reductase (glutaredoxin) [Actinomycetota bacterium]